MAEIFKTRKRGDWIEGQSECYRFQAKIYGEGSRFGINEGRISKLSVVRAAPGEEIADWGRRQVFNYDRGWDTESGEAPTSYEAQGLLATILGMYPER